MQRRKSWRAGEIFLMASTALLAALLAGCGSQPHDLKPFEFIQPKMGTGFRIVIYAPAEGIAKRAADAAFARVDQLNATLSDYNPSSELSRLSLMTEQGPMTAPVNVGDDLWNVLVRSREASEQSHGAFDITVGPFVKLWRRSREMNALPTPERIEKTRASVGYDGLKLFPDRHSVQLLKSHMRLDVGGIAKGYTAMQCMAVIRGFGLTHAMVGAAGDLTVGDPPPGKAYWRVAVQDLAHPQGWPAAYVKLRNSSISTSGDTERFIIIDGVRYSHVIDPHTGLGLRRRIGVTVLSPDGTTSDWLTKPASVLGPEAGLALIDATPGAAGRVVIIDEDGTVKTYESKRWREFVVSGRD